MANAPKDTKDILPEESYKWQYVENTVREIAHKFCAKEIRTPTFEHTEVFSRGVGEGTDIVNKEMYTFLDKLISISLPRVRDFRGLSPKSFDGRGNYTIGIKEQLIFPEIKFDEVVKVRGMDIVIVTTAKTDEESLDLLKELGVPFRK